MTDKIREELNNQRKGEKVKEVEKMEKRGRELVEENKKIEEEVIKVDKELARLNTYRQQLVNQLLKNNGAIELVNTFLTPIVEKNKDAIVAEVKKEEKKEAKKESKKGVK